MDENLVENVEIAEVLVVENPEKSSVFPFEKLGSTENADDINVEDSTVVLVCVVSPVVESTIGVDINVDDSFSVDEANVVSPVVDIKVDDLIVDGTIVDFNVDDTTVDGTNVDLNVEDLTVDGTIVDLNVDDLTVDETIVDLNIDDLTVDEIFVDTNVDDLTFVSPVLE